MYVLKHDNTLVFGLRTQDSYVPHPVLAQGASVRVAGTIRQGDDGKLLLDNASGHYRPDQRTD